MKISIVLLPILLPLYMHAQAPLLEQRVNVQLDSARLEQLVETLEKQAGCRFYYDPAWSGDYYFSMSVQEKTLSEALLLAFRNTDLHFAADDQRHVFITRGFAISDSAGMQPVAVSRPAGAPQPKKQESEAQQGTGEAIKTAFEDNRLYEIGAPAGNGRSNATIAGYIRHAGSGEGISNASILVEKLGIRTVSDTYGYYTLTLPKGRYVLRITCLGMADVRRQVLLQGDGRLLVKMQEFVTSLKAVTIAGEKSSNVRSALMGMQKVDIKTVKQLPRLLGEADIVRVLQTLPGVTAASEASTGLNVRGGSADQTLVLYDGATIFNPSHFFGFFSVFNADVIKDAELYKSSLPVRHGGRLSSTLDVFTREGNRNKFSGAGGIGPLSSHLTLEGPLGKRTSFIAGGRAAYASWILGMLDDPQLQYSRAGFYDGNIKISSELDERNNLYVSTYASSDRFRLDGDTLYRYGNMNGVAKWKHIFNNRLYGSLTAGYDAYRFSMDSRRNPVNAFRFGFNIAQYHAALDFSYNRGVRHRFEGGMKTILYKLRPGEYKPLEKGLGVPDIMDPERALETALYISDQYTVTPALTVSAGLRYSLFNSFGPRQVYTYTPGMPRETTSIQDTLHYASGRSVKTWHGPEPRLALRYTLSSHSSLKLGYTRTRQYIHLLSNTTLISPTDTWKLSDAYVQPQTGDQFSLGYYRNFRSNTIESSLEVYYKRMQHVPAYKNGARLMLNHHIETELANADGKAYGVELLLRKTAGKLNGWLSYTYSRTLLRMNDPLVIAPVNNGDYFPADYDKPHVVNIVANYRFSHRFSMSLTSNYSTGRPVTLPVARYYMGGAYRMFYSHRNRYRVPDYFRTDVSVNIEGNHRIKKLAHSSWTLGIYNLLARRNAYSVYFISENGRTKGYKLSIFGSAIPFLTYNFKF